MKKTAPSISQRWPKVIFGHYVCLHKIRIKFLKTQKPVNRAGGVRHKSNDLILKNIGETWLKRFKKTHVDNGARKQYSHVLLVGIYPLILDKGSFFLKIYLLILQNVITFFTSEFTWSSKAFNFPNFSILGTVGPLGEIRCMEPFPRVYSL